MYQLFAYAFASFTSYLTNVEYLMYSLPDENIQTFSVPSPGSTPVGSPVKSPFGSPTKLDGDSFPELPPFPGSPESISSVTESPVSGQRGPRIKHVCRKVF